jgi:hypothetical protein
MSNHMPKELKEMILHALSDAGGQAYLLDIAQKDHKTFCQLLGRVLPMSVAGDQEQPLNTVTTIRLVAGSSDRSREDDT